MNNMSHLNQQERRHWIIEQLSKGSFVSVTWSTAKSGLTTRTVKQWIEAALASGDKRIIQPPANTKENMVNVVDMAKYQDGQNYPWCTITVDTLVSVKVGGKEYYF